jgi:hypothetical protein
MSDVERAHPTGPGDGDDQDPTEDEKRQAAGTPAEGVIDPDEADPVEPSEPG